MDFEAVSIFTAAIEKGQIGPIVGFLLMIIVFLARKIFPSIVPKKDQDLFAAGTAVVASVAATLLVLDSSWQNILGGVLTGVFVGATAVGFWELLGKRISRAVKRANNSDNKKKE